MKKEKPYIPVNNIIKAAVANLKTASIPVEAKHVQKALKPKQK
jgi:hypothetical protein